MSVLLETTFGDLILDLDIDGSPALCKNILKLAKARYYTNTLIYNVVPGRYCQMGDPRGDGTGGCSIHGLIDSYNAFPFTNKTELQKVPEIAHSQHRFLQSQGRLLQPHELQQKGVVIAMEMGNVPHTIGSQFLITLSDTNGLKDVVCAEGDSIRKGGSQGMNDKADNQRFPRYLSLGHVAEDSNHILSKLNRAYCDDDGRPFADIRIQRALVIHDPFDDPKGMDELLRMRGIAIDDDIPSEMNDPMEGYVLAPQSPNYERPLEEIVPVRIQADDTTLFATAGWEEYDASKCLEEEDEETRQRRLELQQKQEEEWKQKQDTSRAVMLEMLGDLPSADIQAPENVLFVCKLNPVTNDEDLELIFSRFDQSAKAEIIRDPDTGASLQYAFVEFTSNEACNEAYLKMNNALVDDRRIRVDFSQSVAKVWDRYNRRYRHGLSDGVERTYIDRGRGDNRVWGSKGLETGRRSVAHSSSRHLQGHVNQLVRNRLHGSMDHGNIKKKYLDHDEHSGKPHLSVRKGSHRDNVQCNRRSNSNSESCSDSTSHQEKEKRTRGPSTERTHSRLKYHHKRRRSMSNSSNESRHKRHDKKHRKDRQKDHARRGRKSKKRHHKHHRVRHRSRERNSDDESKVISLSSNERHRCRSNSKSIGKHSGSG